RSEVGSRKSEVGETLCAISASYVLRGWHTMFSPEGFYRREFPGIKYYLSRCLPGEALSCERSSFFEHFTADAFSNIVEIKFQLVGVTILIFSTIISCLYYWFLFTT